MIPLILNSTDLKSVRKYINEFIKKLEYPEYSITTIAPEKKELTIDQIRSLKKDIAHFAPRRLFILEEFDNATLEAQNALLKTIEEDSVRNQFILVVSNISKVLPTIQSRARIIELKGDTGESKSEMTDADIFIKDFLESESLQFISHPYISGITREKAVDLLDATLLYLKKQRFNRSVAVAKRALLERSRLQNNNLNPQLTIDNFLIFWKRQIKNSPTA